MTNTMGDRGIDQAEPPTPLIPLPSSPCDLAEQDDSDIELRDHQKSSDVEKGLPITTDTLTEAQKKCKGPPFIGHFVRAPKEKISDQMKQDSMDPNIVTWDGSNDPNNPKNFALWYKWIITIIISIGQVCVYCASSIISTTNHQVEAEFGVGAEAATVGVTTFMFGLGFGPMLMSPLSEFLGRNIIYRASFIFFTAWCLGTALVPTYGGELALLFLAGFSGSAFVSVGGGTISDMFIKSQVGAPMSIYTLAPFIGPVAGPVIGGFINYFTYWRWTWRVMTIWSGVMLILIVLIVPETYAPMILKKKAQRLRKETGKKELISSSEKHKKSLYRTLRVSIARPFQLLFGEPIVFLLCTWTAVLRGILYLFFVSFDIVFGHHGFNLWQVGLAFMGVLVGHLMASVSYPIWRIIYAWLIGRNAGEAPPEFRLPPAMLGGILVPIGLFWFAGVSPPQVHWIVLILSGIPFGAGILLVYTGVFTYLVDAYSMYAASALAANAFLRCTFAACFPLFARYMYEGMGDVGAGCVLGGITAIMTPLPFVFFIYGHKIRARSKFAALLSVNEFRTQGQHLMWSGEFAGEDVETLTTKVVPKDENLLRGWIVVFINKVEREQDRVMMLTDKALYRVKFRFGTSRILRMERVALSDITSIQKGYYKVNDNLYYSFRIVGPSPTDSTVTESRTYRPYDSDSSIEMAHQIVDNIVRARVALGYKDNIVDLVSNLQPHTASVLSMAHNALKLGRSKRISTRINAGILHAQQVRNIETSYAQTRSLGQSAQWEDEGESSSRPVSVISDSYSIGPEEEGGDSDTTTENAPIYSYETVNVAGDTMTSLNSLLSTFDDVGLFVLSGMALYALGTGNFSVLWAGMILLGLYKIEGHKNVKRERVRAREEAQLDPLGELNSTAENIENGLWFNIMFRELWRYMVKDISGTTHRKFQNIVDTRLKNFPVSFIHSVFIREMNFGALPPVFREIVYKDSSHQDSCLHYLMTYFGSADIQLDVVFRLPFGILFTLPIYIDDLDLSGRMKLDMTFFARPPYLHTITTCFESLPDIKASVKPFNEFDRFPGNHHDTLLHPVWRRVVDEANDTDEGLTVPDIEVSAVTHNQIDLLHTKQENSRANTLSLMKSDNAGVVHVKVISGHNLKIDSLPSHSMPYCVLSTGAHGVCTTTAVKKSRNPVWGDFFEMSVKSRDKRILEVTLLARDTTAGDHFIGQAVLDFFSAGNDAKEFYVEVKVRAGQTTATEREQRQDSGKKQEKTDKKQDAVVGEVRLVLRYVPGKEEVKAAAKIE
ncbi:hypothetical protein PROFUN_06445 [Planoprotostelium fungivorum]|uniref:Major facilitator superfamily (MFS) profile domain-containing protein n=1 Tax=Planoprotostelium fungivorum TaxID=1890364 RepID=A0A2P6MQZ5_9EUKA|nr:hypothetical protein PROFUN_06445 [Planoprotostelium fungivorum]